MSEADIEEAKKSMSRAEFEQEYMASFNTYEGQIWNFDKEKCVADLDELDVSEMEMFAGMDVGHKDPTAFCVVAYDWTTELFYIVDEYLKAEATTEAHAIAIKKLIDKWSIDTVYVDSSAAQMRMDFAQLYDISTTNAKKSVLDGIAAVGVLTDNNRLIVGKHCRETIACLDAYQWDNKPGLLTEKPKHNMASHMADALRYALYSFRNSQITF